MKFLSEEMKDMLKERLNIREGESVLNENDSVLSIDKVKEEPVKSEVQLLVEAEAQKTCDFHDVLSNIPIKRQYLILK